MVPTLSSLTERVERLENSLIQDKVAILIQCLRSGQYPPADLMRPTDDRLIDWIQCLVRNNAKSD